MDVSRILAVPVTLPWEQYDDAARGTVLREIEQRLQALPGVQAAGFVNIRPYEFNTVANLSVDGIAYSGSSNPFARWRTVSVGYFEAAGIRMIAGRPLRPDDLGPGAGDRAAAVVSESMAREIWGSTEAALGRRFAMSRNSTNWMRVVGVSEDLRDARLAEDLLPQFFFPDGGWWPSMTFILRTDLDAATIVGPVRAAIWEIAPDLPVPTVEPVSKGLEGEVAGPRFNFVLMLVFGIVALTLAITGVYGVTHLAVSTRTREIGVRMVLGGSIAGMVGMVVRRSAGLAIAGVLIGLALASAGAQGLAAILYGTDPLDPAILGGTAGLLVGCALLAAWIPARRAARVNPASVLRAD
jgi:predicted permease